MKHATKKEAYGISDAVLATLPAEVVVLLNEPPTDLTYLSYSALASSIQELEQRLQFLLAAQKTHNPPSNADTLLKEVQ